MDVIVVNSAGCGSAMKEYERLFARLADGGRRSEEAEAGASPALPGQMEAASWSARAAPLSAKVRDFSEFLASSDRSRCGARFRCGRPTTTRCHLGHAQRITAAPRALLRAIP